MLNKFSIKLVTAMFILLSFLTTSVSGHCDSVEGPVVKAAKEAINSGNINHVLIWVSADNEAEIQQMFSKVVEVRNLSEKVRELADSYFFETVVRVHRMGEGVGYTGLKDEEFKPEEGIEVADLAIENNSIEDILSHVDKSEHAKVEHYFTELQSKKNYDLNNINAGREYVESYVHFIHYIENLYSGQTDIHNSHQH